MNGDYECGPSLAGSLILFLFSSTPLQAFGRLRLSLRRRQRVVATGEHSGLVEDPEG
jgi:hypothetical protein